MQHWIQEKRVFRTAILTASLGIALAMATGAAALVFTEEPQASIEQTPPLTSESATLEDAHDRASIEASEADMPASHYVAPDERFAIDAARALADEERSQAEAAEQARLEAEQRQQAVDAERARQAAARAALAAAEAVAQTATSTPVAPSVAENTVTSALVDARGPIQAAAATAGWPDNLLAKVERVVMCESGGRTTAVAPAGYVGLMQVAPWLHGPVPPDAVGQLAQAYRVYLREGWGAWPVCGR